MKLDPQVHADVRRLTRLLSCIGLRYRLTRSRQCNTAYVEAYLGAATAKVRVSTHPPNLANVINDPLVADIHPGSPDTVSSAIDRVSGVFAPFVRKVARCRTYRTSC